MTRPALPAVLTVVLLVTAGCLGFDVSGTPEYVLTATDVTGNLTDHATADLDRYERGVATAAARNGTAATVGWRAVANGSYVEANGSFYRVETGRNGTRRVTVPTLAVVETDASADLRLADLPEVDRRALGLAYRAAQPRERANASVRDPRYAYGYHYGAGDSRLLASNGSVVRAWDRTLRVVAFEATHEADVHEYRTTRVARNESAFRRAVATNVTLSTAERNVLESAVESDYRVPVERVEAGNASGFTGLLSAAGLPAPEPYDASGSAYVRYDGRYYHLELRYASGE